MCHGITDGFPCDCEQYDPPLDPEAPTRCRECAHGRSKHVLTPSTTQFPLLGETKKSVLDVFAARAAETVSDRLPANARVTDLAGARNDALKHYRLKSNKEDSGDKKPKKAVGIVHSTILALFSDAFLYKDEKSSSPLDTRWFILSREHSIVPNRNPTGADVVKFKKVADNIVTAYIALKKTIPNSVYTGWYTPKVVETSSVTSNDDIVMGSDDFFDESSSNHNPSKDPDAGSDVNENPAQATSGYDTHIAPTASKRKRDSLDSTEQEQPVKKLKLAVDRGITTNAVASSSKVPPLFIGSMSPSPSYLRTPSLSLPRILRASKASKCSCLRVSPPPSFVMSDLSGAYDATMSRNISSSPYINPWHPDYQPPRH
ncbi:hypothetical protein K438DRAFT_1785953 [Mycena galopus ATCC 62051]|nr:hypothetical protein K438DRAFT_1785953 [Mycena galopus ATCC 62051]